LYLEVVVPAMKKLLLLAFLCLGSALFSSAHAQQQPPEGYCVAKIGNTFANGCDVVYPDTISAGDAAIQYGNGYGFTPQTYNGFKWVDSTRCDGFPGGNTFICHHNYTTVNTACSPTPCIIGPTDAGQRIHAICPLLTGETTRATPSGTDVNKACPGGNIAIARGSSKADSNPNICPKPPKDPALGNPIHPVSGRKTKSIDLGLSVGGVGLTLSYDTARQLTAMASGKAAKDFGDLPSFGALWFSSFHRKLLLSSGVADLKVLRGDGTHSGFWASGSVITTDVDNQDTLTSVTGGYLYRNASTGTIETYNSAGQIIGLADTSGNTLTFIYSAGAGGTAPAAGYLIKVIDNAGRTLSFEYGLPAGGVAAKDGLVSKVTGSNGAYITFGYDANRNLTAMTWPDGRTRQFLYENTTSKWALTGEVDENNSRWSTYGYDANGLAVSTELANGVNRYTATYGTPPTQLITTSYDSATKTDYTYYEVLPPANIAVTDPSGSVISLNAASLNGRPVLTGQSQQAGSGCAASNSAASYEASGNLLSQDNFQGQRTCYAYDSSNRETVRVEGLATSTVCSTVTPAGATLPSGARKVATAWHPDWRLPVLVNEPTRKITTIYQGQPDPFNSNATANCTTAANLPNGKPMPAVCKTVEQALLYASGGSPITWDLAYDNVSLLLHADGANGSQLLVDGSSSPKTAVVSGNTALSTAQSKFGGASIYFDGASTSYVSYPPENTIVGSGNLTIEGWIYPTATATGGVYSNYSAISTSHNAMYISGTAMTWYYNGGAAITAPVNSVPTNQWTHFALVRNGSNCAIYINGSAISSATCTNPIGTTQTNLRLGNVHWTNYAYKGYLDDFRITRGVARYTGNFTPSSTAFGASSIDTSVAAKVRTFTYDAGGRMLTSTDENSRTTNYSYYNDIAFSGNPPGSFDPDYEQVVLLLHGNGANGSTSIADHSLSAKTVTPLNDAKVSTAQSLFGGSSITFDGTADFLQVPYSTDFAFGAGDFTIETSVYKNANNANGSRLWSPGDYFDGVLLQIDANGNFSVYLTTTANTWTHSLPVVASLANGQWHHLAVVRSGGSVFAFVNGVKYVVTTALGTTALYSNSSYPRVIGGQGGVNRTLNGYIDEFRITKGKARYTANFTPPTAEFLNNAQIPSPTDIGHTVGDLQSITNAAGHVTQYTQYDRAGRVRQMIDPKGVVTDITYTPRGWVSTVTATAPGGAGRTTSYTYDYVGQLTGVAQPDGTTLSYSYDAAHRLVGVTDAKGNSVSYTLDNAGNRIAEEIKDPMGVLQRSISRSFDALNRVQQVTGGSR
jgi:YD repeat-containing protein